MKIDKLIQLHALRGFAALYVVFCHSKFPFWSGGTLYLKEYPMETWNLVDYLLFPLDMLTTQGTAFVVMFFVLSGFFISYTFDQNNWKIRDFFLTRMVRIYIPFLGAIFLSLFVLFFSTHFNPELYSMNSDIEFIAQIQGGWKTLSFKSFLKALAFMRHENYYLGSNFPYWSLFHEGIFYLLAPLVVKHTKKFFAIMFSLFIGGFYFNLSGGFYDFIFIYGIFFATGMLVYNLFKKNIKYSFHPFIYLAVCLLFFLSIIGFGIVGFKKVSFICSALFTVGCIYGFLNFDIRFKFVDFFQKIGVFSYTLYLYHFPVLIFLYVVVNKFNGRLIYFERSYYYSSVLICVIVTYFVYFLIEKPSIKLISKIKKKSKG